MDCLGAAESPKDYVVAGTAANEMHGLAEAYWRPDMVLNKLFHCVAVSESYFFSQRKSYSNASHKPCSLVAIETLHPAGEPL